MNPISLWPTWAQLVLAALVASILAAAVAWFAHTQREIGRAEIRAEWNAEKIAQQTAALVEAESNAKETKRRMERQKDIQDAHDQDMARARTDAAAARAAADRLSGQLAAFTAAAHRAAGDPAATCDGQAADAPVCVLADLFRRADERAGVLAAALDESDAAGRQCERDYDALMPVNAPDP